MHEGYNNDQWTLIDDLGYEKFVENIKNVIDKAKPPFTLGIYGGWGTGKTSIMKQLFFRIGGTLSTFTLPLSKEINKEKIDEEMRKKIDEWRKELKTESQHVVVWFNPWQHQFDKEPVIGLLHEIREHFNLFSKVAKEARKLVTTTIRSGLGILTGIIKELAKIKLDVDKIEEYGTKYEADNFEIKGSSQRFCLLFEKAVGELVGKNKRLVIFIDDLDRCTDEHIIKLLEGIKLYLSTSNCIFIFGMDQRNVIKALEKKNIHREYLDKLFQGIFRIPLSNNYESFIKKIAAEYFPNENHNELATLLSDILEKNPRKVKNFLNSFRAYWEMQNVKDKLYIKIAALFHYLRVYYELVFSVLERNPDFIQNLANVCKNEPPNNKLEHLFYKHLKNPILEEIFLSTEFENKEKIPASLDNEVLEYMEDISTSYEALNNFKELFCQYCEELITTMDVKIISKYLGVIENEKNN
jgi:predicted KAP-like P-loop ATPase